MFLAEINSGPFRRVIQTVITLPNFVSWVLVYALAFAMFSVDDGFIDQGVNTNKVEVNWFADHRQAAGLSMGDILAWTTQAWNQAKINTGKYTLYKP